ncbi:MAG: glycosyltransferase family 4 protein [Nitrospirae bacterium]|nr:glycosyltransferase family 4 protein [Candidatus Manganitrophaceae bacterium]
MKILHTEASLAWGGQEIRILTEAKGFVKRGHTVVVAAPPDALIFARAQEAGLPTEAVPMQKSGYPAAVKGLLEVIEKHQIDLVHTHSSRDSWLGLFAARFSGRRPRLIRTRHLSTPVGRSWLSTWLYRRPDRIITTGEATRRLLIEESGLAPERIISIPTGVDLGHFQPVPPAAGVPAVGMVAFLRDWKGHTYFIDAAREVLRKMPEAAFYIVGDGPEEERLRSLLDRINLTDRIEMLGYQTDIRAVLSRLDIVVLTSYANEGVPQSLLQAMAMEKPVIGTTVGGIPEVIEEGVNGYLIPPRDSDACAAKILELIQQPALRAAMGRAGRARVEKEFSFDRMLDQVETVYHAALERGGR